MLEDAVLDDRGVELLHILRDHQRQLPAVDDDLAHVRDLVLRRELSHRAHELADDADLMHRGPRAFRNASSRC